MNVTEMHIAVQQGVDKIHSLQADMLLSEEIDIELNKSMSRFINTKYGKNNIYRKGFEESQKRIDDLRTLVTEYEEGVTFKELFNTDPIYVDTFQLPSDYMYLVNQRSRIATNKCKPLQFQTIESREISYILLDFNDFVCNNGAGTSTAFVEDITMVEDVDDLTLGQATIWSPTGFNETWTPAAFPANIESVKQNILDNPGLGFNIYWEQYGLIQAPGQFIVIVDTDTHDWFNADPSGGALTQALGRGYGDADDVYSPALILDAGYSTSRVPFRPYDIEFVGNKFSQQDDIFALLSDPFNTTKHTAPLTTFRGQAIDIYTNDLFIISSVKITYIRRPREISLSLGVDCELPDHTHQEIVSMTVSSILEEISDPRFSSAGNEILKNE